MSKLGGGNFGVTGSTPLVSPFWCWWCNNEGSVMWSCWWLRPGCPWWPVLTTGTGERCDVVYDTWWDTAGCERCCDTDGMLKSSSPKLGVWNVWKEKNRQSLNKISMNTANNWLPIQVMSPLIARFMGLTWGKWAPCWPHEPCYHGHYQ